MVLLNHCCHLCRDGTQQYLLEMNNIQIIIYYVYNNNTDIDMSLNSSLSLRQYKYYNISLLTLPPSLLVILSLSSLLISI